MILAGLGCDATGNGIGERPDIDYSTAPELQGNRRAFSLHMNETNVSVIGFDVTAREETEQGRCFLVRTENDQCGGHLFLGYCKIHAGTGDGPAGHVLAARDENKGLTRIFHALIDGWP